MTPFNRNEPIYYSQENAAVKKYINETVYMPSVSGTVIENYLSDNSARLLDQPAGTVIETDADELLVTDNSNGGTVKIPVKNGKAEIYNIAPTAVGGEAVAVRNGTAVGKVSLFPTGQLRMIKMCGDAFNIRNIGGWKCIGGTVKYGKIIRGSELDGDNFKVNFTPEDRRLFLDLLKVRCEIDLRSDAETAGVTVPALGEGVCTEHYPIGPYTEMINPDGIYSEMLKCLVKSVISHIVAGETVYIHCMLGGDRTGVLCAVLEGILGVSISDIEKDYELTSFSRVREIRTRAVPPWREFVSFVNSFEGNTFGEKIVAIVLKNGISADEIEAFREAMVVKNV